MRQYSGTGEHDITKRKEIGIPLTRKQARAHRLRMKDTEERGRMKKIRESKCTPDNNTTQFGEHLNIPEITDEGQENDKTSHR